MTHALYLHKVWARDKRHCVHSSCCRWYANHSSFHTHTQLHCGHVHTAVSPLLRLTLQRIKDAVIAERSGVTMWISLVAGQSLQLAWLEAGLGGQWAKGGLVVNRGRKGTGDGPLFVQHAAGRRAMTSAHHMMMMTRWVLPGTNSDGHFARRSAPFTVTTRARGGSHSLLRMLCVGARYSASCGGA